MKLKNKKTGDIFDLYEGLIRDDGEHIILKPVSVLEKCYIYHSLAELNEEWEDYEEPKEYWTIDWTCTGVTTNKYSGDDIDDFNKSIGNYFETEGEAEKAVEKLKAWKRLKDKEFRFDRWNYAASGPYRPIWFYFEKDTVLDDVKSDIDLLFSGGEE